MLDLKKQFGKRYRIFYDPSWDAETGDARTEYRKAGLEAWYYEMRGPNVTISPVTSSAVSVLWRGHGSKALKQASISSRRLDGEVTYIIPSLALETVLDAVQVYRRKQVTDAMRARGKALAAKYGKKVHAS